MAIKLGVDLGGTKTEIAALDGAGTVLLRRRRPTGQGYAAIVETIAALVRDAEAELGAKGTLGIGIPGSINPQTGLVRNANSQALNGQPLDKDLAAALGREVRVMNDANCLAMSEAADGAGAGYPVVFAAILGTGVGAGWVVNGRPLDGLNRVSGEWGHTPLPWMRPEEFPGPRCWCGQHGCLEAFLAGPSLAADTLGPGHRDAGLVEERARSGDPICQAGLARHADRLARALGMVVNIMDPDVIVLGGGVSNFPHLYRDLPGMVGQWIFGDSKRVNIAKARHGDSSGVFGAARLWDGG
ncbi:ROK family protein [Roseomonas sp. SSH11]|uniref:ROK family protein n=1 Tax=Pararoseomonas baculiformis TaxID=2820812 RepID=A0ABS4AFY4_9PROT|nr:ROK family protein [Pararoseomonas baculiformis]MBP0445941.1 ROK family protein [Pararoseomonas baculiformis]